MYIWANRKLFFGNYKSCVSHSKDLGLEWANIFYIVNTQGLCGPFSFCCIFFSSYLFFFFFFLHPLKIEKKDHSLLSWAVCKQAMDMIWPTGHSLWRKRGREYRKEGHVWRPVRQGRGFCDQWMLPGF